MKIRKGILALIFITCSFNFASAESDYVDSPSSDEENKLVFKFRLSGIISKSKGSGLPKKTSASGDELDISSNLVANGFGGDVSTIVFFNEHIASELSLGFNAYKTKQSVINGIAEAYGRAANIQKNLNLYSIPGTLTFQYYVAPFGGFSPYVGGGYSLSYFYTNNKAIRVNKFSGAPVLQVGVDFIAQDNTLITLDIKKYFINKDVYYKSSFLYPSSTNLGDLKSKLKLDPLVISAGIGFQF
jgi:outer membrane protein